MDTVIQKVKTFESYEACVPVRDVLRDLGRIKRQDAMCVPKSEFAPEVPKAGN